MNLALRIFSQDSLKPGFKNATTSMTIITWCVGHREEATGTKCARRMLQLESILTCDTLCCENTLCCEDTCARALLCGWCAHTRGCGDGRCVPSRPVSVHTCRVTGRDGTHLRHAARVEALHEADERRLLTTTGGWPHHPLSVLNCSMNSCMSAHTADS